MAHHADQTFGGASVDIESGIGPLDDGAQDIMNVDLPTNARADFAFKGYNGLNLISYLILALYHQLYESH